MNSTQFADLSLKDQNNLDFSRMATVRIGHGPATKLWLIAAALVGKQSISLKTDSSLLLKTTLRSSSYNCTSCTAAHCL
jgi:mannose-1-phosphate guanylyltransferase